MGNQWIKNYDISKKHQFTGGFNNLWKIHTAKKLQEEYSVFIFDKRTLDKIIKSSHEKDLIINLLRKEGQNLSQLRHPSILHPIEPPAEDNKRMICITEKITGTLTQLIKNDQQSMLDVKLIMIQIIEALSFLHNDAKLIHLNISPDNIYRTIEGKYKLGGLMFSASLTLSEVSQIDIDLAPKPYDSQLTLTPNLSFLPPEMTLNPPLASFKSDIFSLGLLLVGLVRHHFTSVKDLSILQLHSVAQYSNSFDCLMPFIQKSQFYSQIQEPSLKELINKMLDKEMKNRPTIVEIYNSEFFMDPLIKLLHSLRQLNSFDEDQQSALLKSISKNIFKFEGIVLIKDLLPAVMPFIVNQQLMPSIIFIAVDVSKSNDPKLIESYQQLCWSYIKKVSGLPSMPAQAIYCLVQNIQQFYQIGIPHNEISQYLLPLYVKCFESDVPKLQEVALQQTQMIIEKIDYQYTKNKILPRLLQLCLDNKNDSANLIALSVLSKTHKLFDKLSISDSVLPMLEKLRKQSNPTKQQAEILLDIYKSFATNLTSDQIVTKLLPQLLPYIIEISIGKLLIQQYSVLLQDQIKIVTADKLKICPSEQVDYGDDLKIDQGLQQNQQQQESQQSQQPQKQQEQQQQQLQEQNYITGLPVYEFQNIQIPPFQIQQQQPKQLVQQEMQYLVPINLIQGQQEPQINSFQLEFNQQQNQQWNQLTQPNTQTNTNNFQERYKQLKDLDLMTFDMNTLTLETKEVQEKEIVTQNQGNINVNYDPFSNWGKFE